jgi:hypothetical protein
VGLDGRGEAVGRGAAGHKASAAGECFRCGDAIAVARRRRCGRGPGEVVSYRCRATRDQRLGAIWRSGRPAGQDDAAGVTHSTVRRRSQKQQARPVAIRSEAEEHIKKPAAGRTGQAERGLRANGDASSEAHYDTIGIFIRFPCLGCQRTKESIDGICRLGVFAMASIGPRICRKWTPCGVHDMARLGTLYRCPATPGVEPQTEPCGKSNGRSCSCLARRRRLSIARSGGPLGRDFPVGRQNPLMAANLSRIWSGTFHVGRLRESPLERRGIPGPPASRIELDRLQMPKYPVFSPRNRESARRRVRSRLPPPPLAAGRSARRQPPGWVGRGRSNRSCNCARVPWEDLKPVSTPRA